MATAPGETEDPKIVVGRLVQLNGLQAKPEYNGQLGQYCCKVFARKETVGGETSSRETIVSKTRKHGTARVLQGATQEVLGIRGVANYCTTR